MFDSTHISVPVCYVHTNEAGLTYGNCSVLHLLIRPTMHYCDLV